jgi:hypothetical protein
MLHDEVGTHAESKVYKSKVLRSEIFGFGSEKREFPALEKYLPYFSNPDIGKNSGYNTAAGKLRKNSAKYSQIIGQIRETL